MKRTNTSNEEMFSVYVRKQRYHLHKIRTKLGLESSENAGCFYLILIEISAGTGSEKKLEL